MEEECRRVGGKMWRGKKRQEISEAWEGLILLRLALKAGGRGPVSRSQEQPSDDSKEWGPQSRNHKKLDSSSNLSKQVP